MCKREKQLWSARDGRRSLVPPEPRATVASSRAGRAANQVRSSACTRRSGSRWPAADPHFAPATPRARDRSVLKVRRRRGRSADQPDARLKRAAERDGGGPAGQTHAATSARLLSERWTRSQIRAAPGPPWRPSVCDAFLRCANHPPGSHQKETPRVTLPWARICVGVELVGSRTTWLFRCRRH